MVFQIHTCTISNNYEEGEDWLVEADNIEQANKKAKAFLFELWYGDGCWDEDTDWDGDCLDLNGGERRLKIEHVEPIIFAEWVEREIEKQSMGKAVKFNV
jgi:hypothetical protein